LPSLRRAPVALVCVGALYALGAFAAEPLLGRDWQPLLGAGAWLLLAAGVRDLTSDERSQVAAVVAVATTGELVFSLGLGFYAYRWHNLPLYVPAGHGLVFTAGLRLSRAPVLARNARLVGAVALAAGAAWAAVELRGGAHDELGIVGLAILAAFVLAGPRPALYACIFVIAGVLELYATAVGTWHWAAASHVLHISAANPPCAVAGGYVLVDALALRLRRLPRRAVRTPELV
jgi:hypothetical protein